MGDKSIPKSRSANLLNQKKQIKKTQKKTKIKTKIRVKMNKKCILD